VTSFADNAQDEVPVPLGQGFLKKARRAERQFRPPGEIKTQESKVDRTQKAEVIGALNEEFGKAGVVVVARYQGMTVADMSKLRSQMRAVGASFKVSKNRLAKRAAEGTMAKPMQDLLKGPTGIAFSLDPIAAPKAAHDYAKTNPKFVILGGVVGTQFLDAKGVEALASLPSLDELRARLAGMLKQNATKIAGILQAPAGQLARVIGAHARKSDAA
jgi:large subunit ribosomal protein L10